MKGSLALILLFAPLLGFLCAGVGGPRWGARFSQGVTCGGMAVSTLAALWLSLALGGQGETLSLTVAPWIATGDFQVSWGIYIDSLSLLMISSITFVSLMVHIYSIGYMKGDPGISRFMAYLSLFTFFMLVLVTAPNFLQLFFGWEGVGVSSYLLIGYWYHRPKANRAALKAFLMNRVGDVGYVLGILTLYSIFSTLDFEPIFAGVRGKQAEMLEIAGGSYNGLTVATLLLFIGAMGKSAQLGLHTWLPDAMEAPTPVSALLHAATMVTAGVFLMVRVSPLLEYTPLTREIIALIGAVTVVTAASIACVQNDIKRIIAYSTMSQLGYMFMAIGFSGYSAAMFHLTTHAFFKATLFLGAGSVIHAMSDEKDIQTMGGIGKFIPLTRGMMWVGSLALAGMPFFAGFYSKDLILDIEWASKLPFGKLTFFLGLGGVGLTAFYAWRLLLLTFQGTPRADDAVMSHLRESPPIMLIPLILLGGGTLIVGQSLFTLLVGPTTSFWGQALPRDQVLKAAHLVPSWVTGAPPAITVGSIGLAYLFYVIRPQWPKRLAAWMRPLYLLLVEQLYMDQLYAFLFVRPSLKIAQFLWKEGDQEAIEGIGPKGFTTLARGGGARMKRLQTGYLCHYVFAMMLGIVGMTGWILCTIMMRSDT